MKGYNQWHYHPYQPLDEPEAMERPYICRLEPGETTLTLEWFDRTGAGDVQLHYALRDSEEWYNCTVKENTYRLEGLEKEREYQFYLENSRGTRSNCRLARTGRVPGKVVNYLHPEDKQYAFSGQYLCSPSIVKLPDGTLLASMDYHRGDRPQNLTSLFRSQDGGENWHYLTDLFPCFWGTLFWHRDRLYMLGVSNEYGDLLIGCSQDGGESWSTPTVILRGSACSHEKGLHRAPMGILHSHGRLWTGVEYGAWQSGSFANGVFSVPENADLMTAENWSYTGFLQHCAAWKGALPIPGGIENNVLEGPDGSIVSMLRYGEGRALLLRNDPDYPEELPVFDKIISFPMGHSKFEVKRRADGVYLAVGNRLPLRNILSVYASKDLEQWEFVQDVVNCEAYPKETTAFQYPAFIFDGEELLVLSRTAFNGASSFHDNNYQTFHRIKLKL